MQFVKSLSYAKLHNCGRGIAFLHNGPYIVLLHMAEQFYKERIRSLMNERGWNQSELAKQARLSQSVLSRFFSGQTKELDVAQLGLVAEAFQILPGDLLPHSDMPVAPEAVPFMKIVAGQPAALRHRLEEMAQLMLKTWADAAHVGQSPTHTADVTPVTAKPKTAEHASSAAIPGVPPVASIFVGPETEGTSDAEQPERRRKHSNKTKRGEPSDHGDNDR